MTCRDFGHDQRDNSGSHQISFEAPAKDWNEALPLGNGHIGAMLFGETHAERIQLNDEHCWSGSQQSERREPLVTTERAAELIAHARSALERKSYSVAASAVQGLQHRHSQAYLPLADVIVTASPLRPAGPGIVTGYRRTLDLAKALHTVDYQLDGHPVRVETFISAGAGVMASRYETTYPGGLHIAAEVSSPWRVVDRQGDAITVLMPTDVWPPHDHRQDPIEYDGTPSIEATVTVGVSDQLVLVTTSTTYGGLGRPLTPRDGTTARERVRSAITQGFDAMQVAHQEDHSRLYDRSTLDTEDSEIGLMFNFGRYLLIASSRPGGLPATLQGIWNDRVDPPWSSNYTTNINLEMNYWGAEVGNLSECAAPLFDLISELSQRGAETASRVYGAPGWMLHHNTDAWGYTQSVGYGEYDPAWAFWPMASAWLVRHLVEHEEFGAADPEFVQVRAWPALRGATEFMLHWAFVQADGYLGTSPSTSPENRFVFAGNLSSVAVSSTMDISLLRDLFQWAVTIGPANDPIVDAARNALEQLPPVRIDGTGRVSEWNMDVAESEVDHRHLSHLYFIYPGSGSVSPELSAAASRSLDARGDDSPGWSLVWKMALRARLQQPDKVDDLLSVFFRRAATDGSGLYPNRFAAHPPFQIDANLGFVAAISECLVQSHRGEIELLPALPRSCPSGSVAGLVARPGVHVDIDWRDHVPTRAVFSARSTAIGAHTIRWRERSWLVDLTNSEPVVLNFDV